MDRKIKRLFYGLSLLLMINICAIMTSAQTAGAINGKIKWKKSYGKPVAERPCEGIGIAAYSQSDKLVGNAIRLGFAETGEYYECSYNIKDLPEGVPLYVSVTSLKGYRWPDEATMSPRIYTYRREFRPSAWSGEVTLRRVRPDFPSRASGDFEMILVTNRLKEKVLVNPKTRFPGLQRPQSKISHWNFCTAMQ